MSLPRPPSLRGPERRGLGALVRRSALVRRFVPGETLDDALAAATLQAALGIGTTLTYLGDPPRDPADTAAVAQPYLEALDSIQERGLPCELSVKLSQLGRDARADRCEGVLETICARAARGPTVVWTDMEAPAAVDATLGVFRRVRERHPHLGLCLQAYLRRTTADVESLIPLGVALRIVKGSYRQPRAAAYRGRRAIADHFFRLGARLLASDARAAGVRAVFATHDVGLLGRLRDHARSLGLGRDAFECHMLLGVRRGYQRRLATEGYPVRALVSYGEAWLAWYVRRLAERPANLGVLLRGLLG